MESTLQVLKERMVVEQYIKNAKRKEQYLFSSLLGEKLCGKTHSHYELSQERLQRLYLMEGLFDSQIAKLFDTERSEIFQLRMKWKIERNQEKGRLAG